ncbi:MAG: HEPN domain-containing protein [Proteobacteria bacterium]|jgi:hypothetical protein|nr:HEPN domain-containing protein [Pseudomonadota bacterium]
MVKRKTPAVTEKARLVFEYATEAKDAFLAQCDASRKARRESGGALTHPEQDLLRAMLVFACAGLDSLLKQLIRDSLQLLAAQDSKVQSELERFVARRIRDDAVGVHDDRQTKDRKFIAHILIAPSPLQRIVEEYILHLTGESLQSPDELFKTLKALGVGEEVKFDRGTLKQIFDARNEIIHEMDIQFETARSGSRKRRSRTIEDMRVQADHVLEVGKKVIEAIEAKLARTAP